MKLYPLDANGRGLILYVPKLTKPAYLAVMFIWTRIVPSEDLFKVIDFLRLPVLTGQSDLILLELCSNIFDIANVIRGLMVAAS